MKTCADSKARHGKSMWLQASTGSNPKVLCKAMLQYDEDQRPSMTQILGPGARRRGQGPMPGQLKSSQGSHTLRRFASTATLGLLRSRSRSA